MKTSLKILIVLFGLGLPMARAEFIDPRPGCCNNRDPNPGCEAAVGDPIDPGTATAYREVTDLTTYGFAPIKFKRVYISRTTNFNDSYWDFGNRQTWQHNWNYEMRQLSTKTFNQFDIKVRYPDGRESNFKAVSATGNQFVPPAHNGDRLYKWSGSSVGYTLVTPDGREFDFWRYLSPAFHLTATRDGKGLSWSFTYDTNAKLQKISNSFGRWIQVERSAVSGISCISRIYTDDGRQVTYSYSSWAPTGSVVLTTVTYPGSEAAHYTWVTADPTSSTARPLLEAASDPMYPAGGARTKFVYNYNASYPDSFGLVTGTVLEERNLDTNALIVSLPLGGGDHPRVLDGDGTDITRKFLNGLLVETADGEERKTTYTYTAGGFGFVETMTEPNGAVTHYTRDAAGRILTQTDGLGHIRGFTYNSAGFVLAETDELNRTKTTTRDSGNRPTRVDHPDATFETWTYNSNGQPLTHRARNGGTESFGYDSAGNMTSKTDALGGVTTYSYYANGLRASMTDARQQTTSYTYNTRGKLLTVTHPDNTSISYQYDAFGNRTVITDELAHTTAYSYDEYNRVKTITDPLNRTTTYEYSLAPGCSGCGYADVIGGVTSPHGKATTFQYDRSRLRTAQTVATDTSDAATTLYAYDNGRNLTTVTDPRGKIWQFGYDLLHRRTSATDPLGNVTTWNYDAVGNKLTETRPDGGVTSFAYDNMNRMTQATDPAGHVTQMTYDGSDNVLTTTDARNNTYTYSYDLLKRRLSLRYPDNSIESYAYDAVGNAITYTTRAGQVKTSTFDNRNRESGFTWSDSTPAVTKSYDAAGRLLLLTNSASAIGFAYDAANQLLSEAQHPTGVIGTTTVSYMYDTDGNRTRTISPAGYVSYAYTNRNQISSITTDPFGAVSANYTYDPAGNRLSEALGNATGANYSYDDAGRLITLDNTQSGASFAKFDYAYNAVNNRVSRTQTDTDAPPKTDTYSYDETDQVVQARYNYRPKGTQDREVNYAYDAVGNRTTVTDGGTPTAYASNNLNQYTTVGSDHPTYDVNGNLTASSAGNYVYDAQNRLVSATSGQSTITFAYDARNRCVKRTINGVDTFLYYDGWDLLEEHNAADVVVARYVHGANKDEMVARVTPTVTTYYHQDALGNTVALTDPAGNLVEKYTYDIYGAPTIKNAANVTIPLSAFGNRFLFTGREYLQEIGLYDYRNRFYSAGLGRFLQTDALRLQKDINLYRYVHNAPTQFVDPSGLCCEEELQQYAEATERFTEATDALRTSRTDEASAHTDFQWAQARAAAAWSAAAVRCATAVTPVTIGLCLAAVAVATYATVQEDRAENAYDAAKADLKDSQREYDEAKQEVQNWKDAVEACQNAHSN